ncbi:hypothetical protein EP7_002107 [Isosphaeraceae bacterium EP7]
MIAKTQNRVVLALALLAAGCNNGPDGAGILNPNPGTGSSERGAERTDQPSPTPNGDGMAGGAAGAPTPTPPGITDGMDRTSAGLAGSDVGGTGNAGGTGARNGGRGGSDAAGVKDSQTAKDAEAVRATPPTIESPAGNSAAGETKPAGNIETGTPKSPQ